MLSLIVVVLIAASGAHAGQEVGNAGGFALCTDGKYYSYDYLISEKNTFGPLRTGMSSHQHLTYIRSQLVRLQDPMLIGFDEFMSSMFTQDPRKKFQWFMRTNLPLLYEPGLTQLLPPNCKTRKQAAYFFGALQGKVSASYSYDLPFLKQVEAQPDGGLQVSFLLVHEWLWNYFPPQKFDHLAMFNRFLHTQALSQITKTQFNAIKEQLLKAKPIPR